ncbi:hypothetical protein RCH33_965 [Flavobacterium daejeonense]|nr:hypothetical protein RCH33_965 [Flavobacterium daejeonense]
MEKLEREIGENYFLMKFFLFSICFYISNNTQGFIVSK